MVEVVLENGDGMYSKLGQDSLIGEHVEIEGVD